MSLFTDEQLQASRQIIDEILSRHNRLQTVHERNLERARQHLVPLLAREGYHEPPPSTYTWQTSSPGDWPYAWEHVAPLCTECDQQKPYQLYYGEDNCLEINHGCLCTDFSLEHRRAFLKAMIPVIGKLDAAAHYIPGDWSYGPRLRIYL